MDAKILYTIGFEFAMEKQINASLLIDHH